MSALFASILSPMPASMIIGRFASRTSSGRMAERDAVAVVGRRALLPQRLRHDAEHGAAVEAEVAVQQRDQLEVA